MQRPGHLIVTLSTGEALDHVPAHVDCVIGAARRASRLDAGALDMALRRGGGFRAEAVYHARRSLGKVGEQHANYEPIEEELGLSREYAIELAEPERSTVVVDALRVQPKVESAYVQTLAATPFEAAVAEVTTPPAHGEAWRAHEQVNVPEAHALEPGDPSVVVAAVDTGVALGHAEFQRKLLAGYDTVRLGLGRLAPDVRLLDDSTGPDFCPRDGTGHGSHVAGVIGARGWRIPPGVAGRALILPVRVLAAAQLGDREAGIGAEADIKAGVKVACELGGKLLNLSFGTPESEVDPAAPRPYDAIVRYAAQLGTVLVAAAGNSGALERFYPACLPEVIAVGSVDDEGRRSTFSTYGAHVALCAPGERIHSASLHGYRVNSGTSFAAPFVAGAAALLVSRARHRDRELTGTDVRFLLTRSARGGRGDEETGHGVLDVAGAIRLLDQELSA
jgi:subtilisin family serine protease